MTNNSRPLNLGTAATKRSYTPGIEESLIFSYIREVNSPPASTSKVATEGHIVHRMDKMEILCSLKSNRHPNI
jgi:hypothetical protein